ncbi:hypothetical protein PVK06_022482 [Gossypium arboreum]|uniref:Uncharacterized protein n=1 Tax=Gossypium arboreum TaxID=29729 RepID=A0ABR0P8J9_GOSAR|nr:hypothetical protein PVK06_022482 [Gossypium arboreum]
MHGAFLKVFSGFCPALFKPCVAEAVSVREALSWLKSRILDFLALGILIDDCPNPAGSISRRDLPLAWALGYRCTD